MISVCAQHHPSRAHLLPRLAGLGSFELVTDPEPDAFPAAPIRSYLEALRRTPPTATHRIVVQDDAVPGDRFLTRLRGCLEDHPEDLLALFVPGRQVLRRLAREAHTRGDAWFAFPNYNWCPTVALCWPRDLALDFLAFGEEVVSTRAARGLTTQGDDPYVGAWVKKRRGEDRRARRREREVWCAVPCLVEHPDDIDSIFRPRTKGPQAGANRARVAALFVG